MFHSLMIFTPKKPQPLHADPTSIPQFCVICNFSPRSILVSCRPAPDLCQTSFNPWEISEHSTTAPRSVEISVAGSNLLTFEIDASCQLAALLQNQKSKIDIESALPISDFHKWDWQRISRKLFDLNTLNNSLNWLTWYSWCLQLGC